ncbi:GatB/YqeY domain-containing protein [Ignavibacterium sp.]|uniref:GatB/YqeY domain-containing protein n=1 Tax=Ignavibacterium sp. TaxID=2651167 RepID=UPI00220F38D2|nr:GatB/YqeY domain-containing protein [Ignavibacterium sp.]BDQ01860.1 MAG: aspartyl-tRNA amidotransferase subunit B [Ignavibacterium sp.]
MSLKEKINNDLKEAMKSGDKVRLNTVRSIRALILEFEKSGANKELTPDDEVKLLISAAKKRKDSIEQFKNAGRMDLVEQEEAELKVLLEYLPKQMTEEEIKSEVQKIIAEVGAKGKEDFAKVMPAAMKSLKGKADGNLVRKVVESLLS